MPNNKIIQSVSRRSFLQLAGLTGGAALLAACGAKPTAAVVPTKAAEEPVEEPVVEEPTEKPVEQPAAEEPVHISWWNQFSTPMCMDLFPKIIADFEAKNPLIKVDYEITGGPPGGGDYIEILLARIAAGNPPDTATLWTPPSEFGARGALMEIDDLMASASLASTGSFYEAPIKSCQWKGKTYGLPASAGAGCMFINKRLFEEAGLSSKREDFPTTWDGLFDVSQKLTKIENGLVTQTGFIPWTGNWLRAVFAQNNGGQIFDSTELVYKLNSENNVEMLTHWLKYLDDLYGGDVEKFNLESNWYGDVYPEGSFQLEKSAIDTSGSWGATDGAIPFDFEITKFVVGPKGSKSMTGFWPNWWAMPKGVVNVPQAWLVTEYFCTEGWVRWYEEGTMDTPAWKGAPADIYCKNVETTFGKERAIDFHKFFTNYLPDAAEMWTSPIESFASDTLTQAIDEVINKVTSPADALAKAQELCQTKLEETIQNF
jgi:multiple sugar transport system substrate-binding protein